MPKVSVIIPVYNVEKFIERCARSLFEQTMCDIEYIFINDCTPDNSISILLKVLDDYPVRKSQVRIINHKKNLGLPFARKTGIKACTGEYIIHCDSDDWVDIEMYKTMYNKAKAEDLDIVWCDFYRSDGITNKLISQAMVDDKIIQLKEIMSNKILGSLWNRLVKRTLYDNDIKYPVHNMTEDYAILCQLLYYANNIGYLEKGLYYYYDNPDSICHAMSEDKILKNFEDSVANSDLIYNIFKHKGTANLFREEWILKKLYCKNTLWPLLTIPKYRELWIKSYREINIKLFFIQSITLREKIKIFLLLSNLFYIYCFIQRHLKKT